MGNENSGRYRRGTGKRPQTVTQSVSFYGDPRKQEELCKFMERPYPKDAEGRRRIDVALEAYFECALEQTKREPGSPPSTKGLSDMLDRYYGKATQSVSMEVSTNREDEERELMQWLEQLRLLKNGKSTVQ